MVPYISIFNRNFKIINKPDIGNEITVPMDEPAKMVDTNLIQKRRVAHKN